MKDWLFGCGRSSYRLEFSLIVRTMSTLQPTRLVSFLNADLAALWFAGQAEVLTRLDGYFFI